MAFSQWLEARFVVNCMYAVPTCSSQVGHYTVLIATLAFYKSTTIVAYKQYSEQSRSIRQNKRANMQLALVIVRQWASKPCSHLYCRLYAHLL